ncbi:hypothetical protein [Streptomyces violascens]|uniref:hypothetical protein n=1 Tax=Streptomyces violascens TaxID=67381 RepID=UPI0036BF1485
MDDGGISAGWAPVVPDEPAGKACANKFGVGMPGWLENRHGGPSLARMHGEEERGVQQHDVALTSIGVA